MKDYCSVVKACLHIDSISNMLGMAVDSGISQLSWGYKYVFEVCLLNILMKLAEVILSSGGSSCVAFS